MSLPPPPDPTPTTPGVPAGWYNDPQSGRMRWWNGAVWTNDYGPAPAPAYAVQPYAARPYAAQPYAVPQYAVPPYAVAGYPQPAGNGPAVAALVLGLVAFFLTPIPLFIGLVFGGIPAILAVVFGIIGIMRAQRMRTSPAMAIVGLCLGGFMLLLIPLGAGTIW